MKLIEIKNLNKTYQTPTSEITAIKNINMIIKEHDIISILGPSGCGKTTFLDILTNTLDYKGTISFYKKLNIGYMMQVDAILPWLTVYENAILTLKLKKQLNKDNIKYVNELLKKYDLYNFINEYPDNLSGGQKQRLALIRTLATKPNILFLDESFSKLDINTKSLIMDDVYKIIKDLKITTIMITHDIIDALNFSNKIVVLSKRPSSIIKEFKIEDTSSPSKRNFNSDLFNKIKGLIYGS